LKSLLTAAVLLIAPVRAHVEPLKIRLAYVVPVTNLASPLVPEKPATSRKPLNLTLQRPERGRSAWPCRGKILRRRA